MNHSPNPPVYSQVAFDIASKIVSGEIKVGERFTGRSLMGSQYGVSSETIRRALGQRIRNQLKNVPELQFFLDDSLEYIEHIEEALKH